MAAARNRAAVARETSPDHQPEMDETVKPCQFAVGQAAALSSKMPGPARPCP